MSGDYEYRVRWEADISAHTADQAAREAYDMMRDPESIPPILEVVPLDEDQLPCGPPIMIDLEKQ